MAPVWGHFFTSGDYLDLVIRQSRVCKLPLINLSMQYWANFVVADRNRAIVVSPAICMEVIYEQETK